MSFLDTMKGQFFISINIEACSLQLFQAMNLFCMEGENDLKKKKLDKNTNCEKVTIHPLLL